MPTFTRPFWLESFPDLAKTWEQWVGRGVLPKEDFDALTQQMKSNAFSAAGEMTRVEMEKLVELLGKAITDGMTIREWTEVTRNVLDSPAYASLVYRTNVSNAQEGARYGLLFGPDGADYPAWKFNAWRDEKNDEPEECPGLICRNLDGKVFLKSNAAARHLMPKVHWCCRCRVSFVSQDELERASITTSVADFEVQDDWDFDKMELIPEALK